MSEEVADASVSAACDMLVSIGTASTERVITAIPTKAGFQRNEPAATWAITVCKAFTSRHPRIRGSNECIGVRQSSTGWLLPLGRATILFGGKHASDARSRRRKCHRYCPVRLPVLVEREHEYRSV